MRIDWKLVLLGLLGAAIGASLVAARRSRGRDTDRAGETERVADHYDARADMFDAGMRLFDWLAVGNGRRWACSQAHGDVLEVAIGTGRNLPYYRQDVRLTGIDISPAMLDVARKRAHELGMQADLRVGDAQALDFPDESFDAVVSTLSMCTIPDYRKAIAEAKRVLRPDGRIVLFEHGRSPKWPVRLIQRLLDPLTVRFFLDHQLREPGDAVRSEGFEIERFERGTLGIIERLVARKPACDAVAPTDAIP